MNTESIRQKWAKILELLPNAHISELVSYRNQRTVACPNKMFVSWKCERWKRKRESNKRRNRRGRRANAIPRASPWLIEVDGWGSTTLGNADSERGKKHHSNTFPFFFFFSHHFSPTWSLFSRPRNRFEDRKDLRQQDDSLTFRFISESLFLWSTNIYACVNGPFPWNYRLILTHRFRLTFKATLPLTRR